MQPFCIVAQMLTFRMTRKHFRVIYISFAALNDKQLLSCLDIITEYGEGCSVNDRLVVVVEKRVKTENNGIRREMNTHSLSKPGPV